MLLYRFVQVFMLVVTLSLQVQRGRISSVDTRRQDVYQQICCFPFVLPRRRQLIPFTTFVQRRWLKPCSTFIVYLSPRTEDRQVSLLLPPTLRPSLSSGVGVRACVCEPANSGVRTRTSKRQLGLERKQDGRPLVEARAGVRVA